MANDINQADFEVVGQGINETPDPTSVPRGGQAPKESVAQMPGAPISGQPAVTPNVMPAQSQQPINQADFEQVDQSDFEELPSYANGLNPNAAINVSPLDLVDRFKLASGNRLGSLKYLKTKFEDAVDTGRTFKVKKDGLWHNVDPNGLGEGDAWEQTKELVGDLTDRVWSVGQGAAGGAQVGGALGAALGGVVGAVGPDAIEAMVASLPETDDGIKKMLTGAGVAAVTPMLINALKSLKANPALLTKVARGGLVGGGIETARTSLGRLFGTYEATPEDQLKDIALESLLGLGNVVIPAGVKPGLDHVEKALVSAATSMSNTTKELVSATTAAMNGQSRWAIRRGLDFGKEVTGEAKDAISKLAPGVSSTTAAQILADDQAKIIIKAAPIAQQALEGRYTSNLGKLLKVTPDDYSLDVASAAKGAMTELAEAGYGKINERGLLEVMSDREIAKLAQIPEAKLSAAIDDSTREAIRDIAKLLNRYSLLGTLSGKAGAKKAIDLRKSITASFQAISKEGDNAAAINRVIQGAKQSLDQRIGQSFADKGVGEAFTKLNSEYASHRDAVKLLQDAINAKDPGAVDNLVKKLVSKAGANGQLKDEVWSLSELVGPDFVDKLLNKEAAKSFLDMMPKTFSGGDMLSTAAKTAGGSTIASPRVLAKEIELGHKFVDFIKNNVRRGVNIASNEGTILGAYRTLAEASSSQDAYTRQLLSKAGLDPSLLDKEEQ